MSLLVTEPPNSYFIPSRLSPVSRFLTELTGLPYQAGRRHLSRYRYRTDAIADGLFLIQAPITTPILGP